jgi:hypothetical protein
LLLQLEHDRIEPEPCTTGNVFDDNPLRPKLGDHASKLTPQSRPFASKACARARAGHILARESSADEIHGSKV